MAADIEETSENEPQQNALPIRQKQPKQQLTKGMEHLRAYVTVPDTPPPAPSTQLGSDAYGVPATYLPLRTLTTAPTTSNNPENRHNPFQFGTRYLSTTSDIFSHNAWDHVAPDPQYNAFITQQTALQREHRVPDAEARRFNTSPEKWWDKFYGNNAGNFFKDRKWLVQEFPVLGEVTGSGYGEVTVLEVGAGAGNTAFPLLERNANEGLRLHACDYSVKAVEVMRKQPAYLDQTDAVLRADVWDVAGEELPPGLAPGSVDIVIMIFVFSALSPSQWARAVRNVYTLLRPGGEVLFRDYGRGDLAQVRFKKGRYLEENFYVRGDGTRVYFFEEAELRRIWSGGLDEGDVANAEPGLTDEEQLEAPRFEIVNLGTDRRMLVNRQRKLKMYRCWMQGLFRKPSAATDGQG